MKLEDIYGPVPEHLGNLLDLTRVKIAANYIRAEKIKLNRDNAMILLNDRSEINNNKLVNKFILQEKLKLSDNYHLKYSYSLEDDFSKKCNDLISIIKELSD